MYISGPVLCSLVKILLLHLLLSFCIDWEDISNTTDSVSSAIQTLRCASYFQLSSRCLDIPIKHHLSCSIYHNKNFTKQTIWWAKQWLCTCVINLCLFLCALSKTTTWKELLSFGSFAEREWLLGKFCSTWATPKETTKTYPSANKAFVVSFGIEGLRPIVGLNRST